MTQQEKGTVCPGHSVVAKSSLHFIEYVILSSDGGGGVEFVHLLKESRLLKTDLLQTITLGTPVILSILYHAKNNYIKESASDKRSTFARRTL